MRIFGIAEESIVDGPGIRFVIFTQGCKHHCKGCHNPESHDVNAGTEMTIEELCTRMESNPLITGLTISGGDPFLQPEEVLALIKATKKKFPEWNIIVYTGYVIEELWKMGKNIKEILKEIDMLIDGPYIEEQKSLELPWRGSANQRILQNLKEFQI